MGEDSAVFVGIDAAKAKHAVAVAEAGRQGKVRYLGAIDTSPEAVRKLITRLAARHASCMSAMRPVRPGMGSTVRSWRLAMPARWWRLR